MQVANLVNELKYNGNNNFVIHIDKKSDIKYFKNTILNKCGSENIYFTNNNVNVKWGGFSFLKAIKELISSAFKHNIPFDYLSLISVQCYPVKNNKEISNLLNKNYGYSFLETYEYSDITKTKNRLNRYYFYDYYHKNYNKKSLKNFIGRFFTAILPYRKVNFTPYWGRIWWFLYKEHADYILKTMCLENEIYKHMKYTLLPDEIYFATIIKNSPYKDKIISKRTTYANYNEAHPDNISEDLAKELRDGDYIFARKFIENSKGLKLIKELLAK